MRLPAAFFVASLACLTACAEPPASKRSPDVAVVRSAQEPDSLNPYLSGMSAAGDATAPIFSGLLAVDDQLGFVPDLALEVPTPENGGVKADGQGMLVTYRLRKGVTWHDGKPFTAADVAFTARVLNDPNVRVVERQGYDMIDRVDTPDPHTVRVRFREIYAPYRQLFSSILPEHRLKGVKDLNLAPYNRAPIGTGPFAFVSWTSGDRIVYKAHPGYFRGKPGLGGLEIKFVPDDNAAFAQLKAGAIDVYQTVNLSQHKALRKLKQVKLHETPGLIYEHLTFNNEKPFFKDVRVRRAIAHAIDKGVIADKVYDGIYKPAWSDQNPLSWAFSPELENATPFDPARSAQLLDEAGWKRGPDGIRVKDGRRFSVEFATTAGKKNRETAQLIIRHYLRQVGIDVRISNLPGALLFGGHPHGHIKGGKFDMAMWAWSTGPDPDNLNLWHSKRHPPAGSNVTRYANPELDQLLESATRTFKQGDRQKLYRKASAVLASEVPNMPLFYWTVLDAVNAELKGFAPNPSSAGNLWNVHEWRMERKQAAK